MNPWPPAVAHVNVGGNAGPPTVYAHTRRHCFPAPPPEPRAVTLCDAPTPSLARSIPAPADAAAPPHPSSSISAAPPTAAAPELPTTPALGPPPILPEMPFNNADAYGGGCEGAAEVLRVRRYKHTHRGRLQERHERRSHRLADGTRRTRDTLLLRVEELKPQSRRSGASSG